MTTRRFFARLSARHNRRLARRILGRAVFYGSEPITLYLFVR